MNDRSCIFILADGARADLFEYLLDKGELPNISEHIVDKGSYSNGVTVFPSTTGPAYTPYLLGKFPGRCNLRVSGGLTATSSARPGFHLKG